MADPTLRGLGCLLRLLRRSRGGPRGGGALRCGGGQALPPRGGLLLRDLLEGVRPPGRPRATRDSGDRPRRRPDGREVRPPRVRGPGRHRTRHAALAARRPDALGPYRRTLRRPLRLPQSGGALVIDPYKLRVSNVRYLAGEAEIIRGVTFAVQAGEVFSVVGPSGAGKSTLLRTINRLVESTAGNIFLDGAPIEEINPLELRRRIGMVFQLPAPSGAPVEVSFLSGGR